MVLTPLVMEAGKNISKQGEGEEQEEQEYQEEEEEEQEETIKQEQQQLEKESRRSRPGRLRTNWMRILIMMRGSVRL